MESGLSSFLSCGHIRSLTVHLLMLYLQTCNLLFPDAHAQIKHAHSPAAQGHRVSFRSQKTAQCNWLWSRGCCLIYGSSLWACACRAFAYLLCHRAGNQLWAKRSGTMHLPGWSWAKYLIQPIRHTCKTVMSTLWNLQVCARFGVKSNNLAT